MKLRTLLCPTDFSTGADDALQCAVELARSSGETRICLLHVDDLPTYGLPEGSILDEPLREQWSRDLEARASRHGTEMEIEAQLGRGRPSAQILERAESLAADMIVMSTKGHSGLARFLLGSVAEKVVRLSPVPVLTIHPGARMPDVRRILCLVDFSESSNRATEYAIGLAEMLGSELHLLHCYTLPVYPMPDGAVMVPGGLDAHISAAAQRDLDALRERFDTKVVVVEHLTEGLPHWEVERLAGELGIDMVVMGTHGRTGVKRLLLGSVAERVVRTSPVPVITVPSPAG